MSNPPDLQTIELALLEAEHECQDQRPGSYWFGAREALRWALGQRLVSPISAQPRDELIPLDRAARQEAELAYEALRRPGLQSRDYLAGIENTLMWVGTGRGFAGSLHRETIEAAIEARRTRPPAPPTADLITAQEWLEQQQRRKDNS